MIWVWVCEEQIGVERQEGRMKGFCDEVGFKGKLVNLILQIVFRCGQNFIK